MENTQLLRRRGAAAVAPHRRPWQGGGSGGVGSWKERRSAQRVARAGALQKQSLFARTEKQTRTGPYPLACCEASLHQYASRTKGDLQEELRKPCKGRFETNFREHHGHYSRRDLRSLPEQIIKRKLKSFQKREEVCLRSFQDYISCNEYPGAERQTIVKILSGK